MSRKPPRLVLVGDDHRAHADSVLTVTDRLRAAPGFYVMGDTDNPNIDIPIVSFKGRLFTLAIDREIDLVKDFPATATFNGPHRAKAEK